MISQWITNTSLEVKHRIIEWPLNINLCIFFFHFAASKTTKRYEDTFRNNPKKMKKFKRKKMKTKIKTQSSYFKCRHLLYIMYTVIMINFLKYWINIREKKNCEQHISKKKDDNIRIQSIGWKKAERKMQKQHKRKTIIAVSYICTFIFEWTCGHFS